jgi:hypothetical protein
MNGEQIDFLRSWTGPADETYFTALSHLDPLGTVATSAPTTAVTVARPRPAAAGSLADALTAVETFVRRFVVFGRPEAIVPVALWIAHTYALDAADATPYLAHSRQRIVHCHLTAGTDSPSFSGAAGRAVARAVRPDGRP